MIRTFLKFRCSNRLDALSTGPEPMTDDPEVLQFTKSLEDLDRRLRVGRTPVSDPPPWLHAAIMKRVEDQAVDTPARVWRGALPPAWAGAIACLALAGLLWLTTRPASGPEPGWKPGAVHADADALLRAAVSDGAVTLVEPLELELTNLSKDLERTTSFLLASLP